MNCVSLVGRLTRAPTTRFEGDSLQVTSLTLAITEPGREGRAYTLYVPCQAYGRAADVCGTLGAADLVAVVGRLSWQKRTAKCGQEHSHLVVSVRDVQVLQAAEVAV